MNASQPVALTLVLVLVAAAVAILALRRRSTRSSPAASPPASGADTIPAMLARLTPGSRARIGEFIASGRKIDAIREARATLGVGLYEAKLLVDHMDAGAGEAGQGAKPSAQDAGGRLPGASRD